jgi:gliding motility-associated-like protein
VYGLPQVKLPADTIVPRGFPLDIKPSVAVGTYAWTPADGLSSAITANVTATPLATTTYVLTVTDVHGCINQDTMVLHIDANYALKDLENTISNILTPDGNGKNDMWVIPNISFYPDNTVYIFDRWGQEVFRATNYQNNWIGTNDNGDKLPDGTYYFVIDFGSSKVVHKGAITIMSEMDNSPLFK